MKKEKTEELFVKWIDGMLSAEEEHQLKALMEEDATLHDELQAMKTASEMVSESIPASQEPPYGDFFTSQLMRKVDLEVEAQRPAKKAERWWESLRWAWAPAGALALVLSFFAGHRIARPAEPVLSQAPTQVVAPPSLPTVYFAGESLEAEVIADADGEVSAIVVKGLAELSDDFDFATVTTHNDLPQSYARTEARRFH